MAGNVGCWVITMNNSTRCQVPKKRFAFFMLFLAGWTFLTACGAGGRSDDDTKPTEILPTAQVRIGLLPTVTPEPKTATPQPQATETSPPTLQVQAWPTLDEEQYLLSLIDGMIDKIERRLNSTNTEIRP